MAMQDDNFFALGAREFFETLAQFDFFTREQLDVESSEFPEGSGFAKDKRAGHPVRQPADAVP